jgi:hypothetical protein
MLVRRRIAIVAMISAGLSVCGLALLCVLNPEGAGILAAQIALTASGYPTSPPPIAEGSITADDWSKYGSASAKFTSVLARRFPKGSDADELTDALIVEGFEFRDPLLGKRSATFTWGNAVCKNYATVIWTADTGNKVDSIEGWYSNACL